MYVNAQDVFFFFFFSSNMCSEIPCCTSGQSNYRAERPELCLKCLKVHQNNYMPPTLYK